MQRITVIGGGLAGLAAAITAAEAGARVDLLEAREELGGRGRSSDGRYTTNLGPHVLYRDGAMWAWLRQRGLLPPTAQTPLGGIRVRWEGALRRTPPLGAIPAVLRLRGRSAPTDRSFHDWVCDHADERTAAMLSAAAGVYTFHHDPGELSAAFVWPRTVRTLLSPPPAARYVLGGWSVLIERMAARARELEVTVRTGHRVEMLPEERPLIVATELDDARELLGDHTLRWRSGRTLCLDLALDSRRGDPFIVSDLDEAGWVERFTVPDPSMAPEGEELVQAQMPIRPEESVDGAALRLERLLDLALPDHAQRVRWRRRQVMDGRSGALDFPGQRWQDRPGVQRGDDVFLAGDMVAAPGLLSEVSVASGIEAARGALAVVGAQAALRPAA